MKNEIWKMENKYDIWKWKLEKKMEDEHEKWKKWKIKSEKWNMK